MYDERTELTAEINSERGDILVHGFCSRGIDCIVDTSTCDYNQQSHFF